MHIFPTRDLPLWLAALRARVPPREPNENELQALSPSRRDQVIGAICAALDRRQLTRDDLESEVRRRVGDWAMEAVFPAFGGHWPRWQLALGQAAMDGLMVYGPNRGTRVTYARTDQWLPPLAHVDGQLALREVCRRYLAAYGPVTHVEFARWFGTRPAAARDLMRSVMTPPAKAGGFSGHGPGNPHRYGLKAPSEPWRGDTMQSERLTARYVLRPARFGQGNPPNVSRCEGAAGPGVARGHAATAVYRTYVRDGNVPPTGVGAAFLRRLQATVPCRSF